jgi:hypothetical protein
MKKLLVSAAALVALAAPAMAYSEDDAVVAFGAALTLAYSKCGGAITDRQIAAIKSVYNEHGQLIEKFYDVMSAKKCPETVSAYRKMVSEVARRISP